MGVPGPEPPSINSFGVGEPSPFTLLSGSVADDKPSDGGRAEPGSIDDDDMTTGGNRRQVSRGV